MAKPNAMEVIARASLYFPELARGVEGLVEVSAEDLSGEAQWRAIEEIQRGQLTLIKAGWRRDKQLEKTAPYDPKIEVAVYWKRINRKLRWIVVTSGSRFGVHAEFRTFITCPW